MSAEREVFKSMGALIALRNQFQEYYEGLSRTLVQQALREFLLEHPEVVEMRWEQRSGKKFFSFPVFQIRLMSEWEDSRSSYLEPKLAKCLKALEENFHALRDATIDLWGEGRILVGQGYVENGHIQNLGDPDVL